MILNRLLQSRCFANSRLLRWCRWCCGCSLKAISILLHLRPVGSIVVLLDWFPPWSLGPFIVPVPGEPRTVGLAYVAQMVWLVASRHAPHVSEGAGAGLAAGTHRVGAVGTDVEGLGSATPALSVGALLLLIRTHVEDQLGRRAVWTGGLGAVRASGGLVLLVTSDFGKWGQKDC